MKYSPAKTAKIGSSIFAVNVPVPAGWETQENISEGIQIENICRGLSQVKGQLQSGRYCIRLQHEPGIEDCFYVFDVKER
jgi:hypothetical protein